MTTGFDAPADRIRGIEAGADAFLLKPFDFRELTSQVEALVRLKRQRDELRSVEARAGDDRG